MNRQQAIQELGINQIRIINRFFDLKLEVLFALLKYQDIAGIAPIQHRFTRIDRTLDKLLLQLDPAPGESTAAQVLRLRGCNALRRMAKDGILRTRDAVAGLAERIDHNTYTPEEWGTILDTMDSLVVILESNLYLLDNSDAPEEAL